MKESTLISYNYAKYFLQKYLNNNYYEYNSVHIHLPEGAIPKDGPSAGITITSALISLAINQSIIPNIAMTGELSLNG